MVSGEIEEQPESEINSQKSEKQKSNVRLSRRNGGNTMGYASSKFEKVVISSHKKLMPGQDHRCSNNYDLSQLKKGNHLKFTFSGAKKICLKREKGGGSDKDLAGPFESGYKVPYDDCVKDEVYVADVVGDGGSEDMFTITIESV